MKFYKVGCNKFRVTMKIGNNEILIATIDTPLIGMDTVYITMYFPYSESSELKLDASRLYDDEILDIAKHTIMKKMYKAQSDILEQIQFVEFDDKKYYAKYSISDNFAKGRVFAVK